MKIDCEPGKSETDRPDNFCCRGRIHVETGAKVVTAIGAVLSVLLLLPTISMAVFPYVGFRFYLLSLRHLRGRYRDVMSLSAFVNWLVCSLAFVATQRRKPGLYAAYLILHAILIAANTMCLFCSAFLFLFMRDDEEAAIRESFQELEPLVLTGAALVVDVATEVILVWFWCVVAKAYRFTMMSYGKL